MAQQEIYGVKQLALRAQHLLEADQVLKIKHPLTAEGHLQGLFLLKAI